MTESSTKPYFIRAIYEWCVDNGFTPYLAVSVDENTTVPADHVKDGQIVLNVSASATQGLLMKNVWIEFQARFNGIARSILIPVPRVTAIYARENGQGMAFEVTQYDVNETDPSSSDKANSPGLKIPTNIKDKSRKGGPRLVSLAASEQQHEKSDQSAEEETDLSTEMKKTPKPSVKEDTSKKEDAAGEKDISRKEGKKDNKKSSAKKKSHLTRIK